MSTVGEEIVVEVPPHSRNRSPELRLRIETGAALDYLVKAGSADFVADETLGEGRLSTGSGDIRLRRVDGRLDARTGSGDIRIESAAAAVAASTGSGDVRIGEAVGPVKVKVGSGDITIERVRDHSVATSGSGDVRVEEAHGPSVVAESARGDVHVGVPAGTPTYLDLKTVTGEIACELEPGEKPTDGRATLALRARTVSGDITVVRV